MRLARRLVLNTVIVAALLVAVVLTIAERRVAERLDAARDASSTLTPEEVLVPLRRDILISGVLVLLIGVGVAHLLARPVVRPIVELRDVARSMAEGDLTRRPSREGRGEVGDLDDALRQLAEQLGNRITELNAEEALLVALIESLNEGVIAVDRREQVVRINETARMMLRLGRPVPFPVDYLPRDRGLRNALATVLSGGSPQPGEVQLQEKTFALTARSLPSGGAILALYDLTPFKRVEAVRRDFVANVSHELRTPLTIISGFVETLHDEDMPAELRRQFLGMASKNVMRMQSIIDDLLDLSRIQSGGWMPNPSEQDMETVAADVLSPLQQRANSRGVALRVQVAGDAKKVFADHTAIRQILTNLAENALRHTPAGEIVLFSRRDSGGLTMGVRDTGTGISAEHIPRIFERFYRADPGRSRAEGGTGLGLSIVKHLAESHGGRVSAESEPGVGTVISVWLPLRTSGDQTEDASPV